MNHSKEKLSAISAIHYFKLILRSYFLISVIIMSIKNTSVPLIESNNKPIILKIIWIIFLLEIISRFFPSKYESMGCQKQFAVNYKSTGKNADRYPLKPVIITASAWILLNGFIAVLYFMKIINSDILLIISLAYSVCDMICILFFCPFQTWFLKNKCCTDCRIYNWDYAMMFTPFIFINSIYTWSLAILSILLLIKWEYTAYHYPERFSSDANICLSCMNCKERLCNHKKHLKKRKLDES